MTRSIADVCAAVGVAPTAAQRDALERYLALLQRWNATYNVVGARDAETLLTHHVADCIAVVPPLRRVEQRSRLLDVGSGGGLPGAVIAVLMPDVDVTCIDAVGKKAAFVTQTAAALALPNLRGVHGRVESLRNDGYDVIAARAFSSLPALVKLTRPLLAPGGCWLAMKGLVPHDELGDLGADVVFHVEPVTVPTLSAERCIAWLKLGPNAAAMR